MPFRSMTFCFVLLASGLIARADPPDAKYIFPAGGRRGTNVPVRIGGCNFHDRASFHVIGTGLKAASEITRMPTLWFEGPVIPQPASQAKEDYPLDYSNSFDIASDAAPGMRWWKVSTSQGVTGSLPFVIGELPEVVEDELPGEPVAVPVTLPVTVNGRIFPREDIDVWSFQAAAGQVVTCAVDAQRIGSPLMSRVELLDGQGRSIQESLSTTGEDPSIRFTVPQTGTYSIRIHDVSYGGLQNYVYRLTITAGPFIESVFPLGGKRGTDLSVELTGANLTETLTTVKLPGTAPSMWEYSVGQQGQLTNTISLELDDLPEFVASSGEQLVTFPAVLNGRILRPGEMDQFQFEGKKGDELDFDLRAMRLGSPLDSVVQILDANQKLLVENDDLAGNQSDSRLRFPVPADGKYTVRITDRLSDRGGPRFGYRLKVTSATVPSLQLHLPSDAITIERGKSVTVKLTADRGPGVNDEINLQVEGLPAGVTLTPLVIGKGQREVNLTVKATDDVKIACLPIRITGKTTVNGMELTRTVGLNGARFASPAVTEDAPAFWLAVAMPTPFKFAGVFETKYMPRGSAYVRHYTVQRNGFAGALVARLADNQGRHLQGVTGDPVAISPGQSEFDFTVKLQPWMEIGRTSRTTLSVMGTVVDSDGSQHVVSYSSNAQNDQMIALVDPGRLAVSMERRTLRVMRGTQAIVEFRLQRSNGLKQATEVELIVPKGIQGVAANRISIAPQTDRGELTITFDQQATGPFRTPVLIRASTLDERDLPVIAEIPVELVAE